MQMWARQSLYGAQSKLARFRCQPSTVEVDPAKREVTRQPSVFNPSEATLELEAYRLNVWESKSDIFSMLGPSSCRASSSSHAALCEPSYAMRCTNSNLGYLGCFETNMGASESSVNYLLFVLGRAISLAAKTIFMLASSNESDQIMLKVFGQGCYFNGYTTARIAYGY